MTKKPLSGGKKETIRQYRRLSDLIVSDSEYVTFTMQTWAKKLLKRLIVTDGEGVVYKDEMVKRIDYMKKSEFYLPYGIKLISDTKLQDIELNAFNKGVEYERDRLRKMVERITKLYDKN